MIIATQQDKNLIIELLYNCFVSIHFPNSMNYVVHQDHKRKQRFRYLMEYQVNMALKFGTIFLSDHKDGCILLVYPEQKKTTILTLFWNLKLISKCIGYQNVFKVLKREAILKKMHPKTPFIHFWLMGVAPESQNKGIGSSLLSETIDYYKNNCKPLYLETTTQENLKFYTRHGFTVFNEVSALDYPLYALKLY